LVSLILVSAVCPGCGSGALRAKQGEAPAATSAAPATDKLARGVIDEVARVSDAATRNELLGLVGIVQATFGDAEGAWSAINKIDQAPAKVQALGPFATFQAWIANIRAAEGDFAGGRKAYTFAWRAAQNIARRGHGGGDMIVSFIKETSPDQWEARARQAAGDRTNALQAALKIEDPRERVRVLLDLAKAQAMAGEISQAQETVKHIEPPGEKWQALQSVAIAQSRAADVAGAQNTIRQIEEIVNAAAAADPKRETYFSRPPALALAALASAQSKAGDAEAAKQSLSAAHQAAGEVPASQISSLLRDMTRTQLEFQDQAGAKQTFVFWENLLQNRQQELSKAYGMWNESHKTLSMALAEAGQLEDSKRVLAKIGNKSDQPAGPEGVSVSTNTAGVDEDAIAAIIRTQLSRGDPKGALDSLEPIAHTARATFLRDQIVKELLKSNDYDAVLAVAEKIPDANTRFWLLIRGDVVSRVPGALTAAAETARQIPDTPGMKKGQARDNALRWVVEAQARAGEIQLARETLKEIQDEEEKSIAVASIAKAEGAGNDSRTAKGRSKEQSDKKSDLVARFEAARTLSDWQGNQDLQRQLWEQVSIQLSKGNTAGARDMLRQLVQLAARRFRSLAVTAEPQSRPTRRR
jgi:hypothetical protein